MDAVCLLVNPRIGGREPAVSESSEDELVKQSDIKSTFKTSPGGKVNGHCGFLSYGSIEGTIEQGEPNWRNQSGPNSVVDYKVGVNKTMQETRIALDSACLWTSASLCSIILFTLLSYLPHLSLPAYILFIVPDSDWTPNQTCSLSI